VTTYATIVVKPSIRLTATFLGPLGIDLGRKSETSSPAVTYAITTTKRYTKHLTNFVGNVGGGRQGGHGGIVL